MGVFDDLANFAKHVVQGDLKGAVGDIGQGVHDVAGTIVGAALPGIGAVLPGIGAAQAAIPGALAGVNQLAGQADPCARTPVQPTPARGAPTTTAACCDRFTFNSGFLVDGATGAVWQFNQRTKAFEEVPVNHSSSKQSLIDSLVETKLNALRSQYESEHLATMAPAVRAKQLAAFEKEQLAPLRIAAKALRY